MSNISLTIDPPEVDDREEEEAKWMQLYFQQFSSERLVKSSPTDVDAFPAEAMAGRNRRALRPVPQGSRRRRSRRLSGLRLRGAGNRRLFPNIGRVFRARNPLGRFHRLHRVRDISSDDNLGADVLARAGYVYRAR
ncbi:uncharacterized protein LOC117587763 isoform X2 [Drosophila guanche]|uniref:Uncharacterized protein n=1 Tax=Drosophila guanche TaxID=7266 RepID=A0A3B0KKJ9_DROGU|nr:uncharacterized protein LOC117587763 isoform X2 [Drosophila guanche]SPP85681.1 Hypothetical predicted protein [Drosophila guanche]